MESTLLSVKPINLGQTLLIMDYSILKNATKINSISFNETVGTIEYHCLCNNDLRFYFGGTRILSFDKHSSHPMYVLKLNR